jgi:hypothetical protein
VASGFAPYHQPIIPLQSSHNLPTIQVPLPNLSGLIPKADDVGDTDDFQDTNDLQRTGNVCSQVIPILKSSNPDTVDCYSVYAAQQGIKRLVSIKRHPYDLAFALTDFKLQGRTLPKLVLSVCKRKRMPWMTLQAFYVLVSRVPCMSGLRLLQYDQDGIDSVRTLQPDKYLYAWERGYDNNGIWQEELAKIALHNLRQLRVMETQAAETQMREDPFIDNQRSPTKKRSVGDTSPQKQRQSLNKCKHCKLSNHTTQNIHTTRTCPTQVKKKKPKRDMTNVRLDAARRLF